MTDTSREALIAMMRDYAYEGDTWVLQQEAADMLEADAQQRSKPHGHCTHPKCKDIFGAYLDAMERLAKYEPGATMHLNSAQQVAVPVPLSDEQIKDITADNSLDTIHAVARAIERHHGIGAKQ